MQNNYRNAFTLIELLVVVAIIIALLAILMPSMSKALIVAQRTVCLTNQQQITVGLLTYASEHFGFMPTSSGTGNWRDQPYLWADAYDWRNTYLYTGPNDRPPVGMGLMIKTGAIDPGNLAGLIHCPSFDNSNHPNATIRGHCMDANEQYGPWNGGSAWFDKPDRRVIGAYNYRGISYESFGPTGGPPRTMEAGSTFMVLTDVPDLRHRGLQSAYNAHGGYNTMFGDGGGLWIEDTEYVVDGFSGLNWGSMDGRGGNDELAYEWMGGER